MNESTSVSKSQRMSRARPSRPRRPKQRWYRVRVETEGGVFAGSLRLGAAGLRRLLDDERAYLALWNVAVEGSAAVEEFVALHKSAIRSVVVVGDEPALSRPARRS